MAAFLVATPAGAQGRASRLKVSLVASVPNPVPQGMPFGFTATAHDPSSNPASASIVFELIDPGGGPPVRFQRWRVAVPPFGDVSTSERVTPAQWFDGLGTFEVQAVVNGSPIGSALNFDVTSPTVIVPRFQDVTAAAGLQTTLPVPVCGAWSGGAAWGDVNGDGALDLYVPDRLGPAQLFMNDGAGHFTDEAAQRGVTDAGGAGVGAVFGDYDNDGYLDLYVVNHAVCTHGSRGSMSEPDVLYHNDGDGTFTDVTDQLPPLGSTDGAGFQAAWVDYNGDGRQDLYLANDSYYSPSDRNHLWRNDGPGLGGTWRFTDVSALSGADYSINSMGIGIADVDRDLDLDMAISNKQGNVLARNNGDGTFTDVAGPAGVQRPLQNADQNAITWGLAFGDLNLDGWEDLYVASGPILAGNAQPNELFVNTGHGGVFADLSAPSQALVPGISRGLAFADYDRDGRIDVYVVRLGGSPVLLHNITDTSGLHWLEVQTVGTVSNRQGCGARLVLTVGKVRLLREVFCGSTSLSSGSDPTAHFGLGGHAGPLSLTVDWPSGARSVVSGLSADRLVQVIEPS